MISWDVLSRLLAQEQRLADHVSDRAGWFKAHSRELLWIAVASIALSFVMFKEVNTLLHGVEGPTSRSQDAGVFTSFKLDPWNVDDLRDATTHWRCVAEGVAKQAGNCPTDESSSIGKRPPVKRFVVAHLLIDLFLFTPAYSLLLWFALRAVGVADVFSRRAALAVFLTDTAETVLTLVVLHDLYASDLSLVLIQSLSFAKWSLLAVALVPLVACSLRSGGGWSVQRAWDEVRNARNGGAEHPAIALSGLIILTALFAGFIALPAGGPLDQIPDALRYQVFRIGRGDWRLILGSGGALLALSLAVTLAGFLATDWAAPSASTLPKVVGSQRASIVVQNLEDRWTSPLPHGASNWLFLVGPLSFSLLAFGLAWLIEGSRPGYSPFALLIVCLAVMATSWLARSAGVNGRPAAVAVDESIRSREERRLWVGGLAGVVLIAGGLGVVRAAFPPALLGLSDGTLPWFGGDSISWSAIAVVGGLVAVGSGFMAQWLVLRLEAVREAYSAPVVWWGAAFAFGALVTIIAIRFAYDPRYAHHFGATGVAAWCLAFFALLLGLASWLSRRLPRWSATGTLGFGLRTPWMTLLLATWVVAMVINTGSGYHNARVSDGYSAPNPRYATLGDAFDEWRKVQLAASTRCPAPSGRVPLVLVAAPGGGIKAAFWTERALDELFGGAEALCAGPRLFAISGVSGGSLGATTWVAATAKGGNSELAIDGIADDKGLSAAVAGLLLRDVLQPFTGIKGRWRDRAALLEDDWIESAGGALGDLKAPLSWSAVGDGRPWTPVLILNGSSVNDGCRVVVSNTGLLPSGPGGQSCYAAPTHGASPMGPISGALDPFEDCRADVTPAEPPQRLNDMRAATAVLLSARFPVVSPSGALRRCLPGQDPESNTTYVVDGGYYENSGLLSLLQAWSALEPRARAACADSNSTARLCVEPWFLVLDSHYRSRVTGPEPGRPNEVTLLLSTPKRLEELISDRALEQIASRSNNAIDPRESSSGLVTPRCSGLVHLGLTLRPAIAAPLGWVLSEVSRRNLKGQLAEELSRTDTQLAKLRRELRGETAEQSTGCEETGSASSLSP